MFNASIFREYDIRGLHETDLTPDVVELIGKAVGTELLRRGETNLCVASDVRTSSPRLKGELIGGLLSTGITVYDVGILPTPGLYFSIMHLEAGGGVQITGSHNPVEYNGFKLCHGMDSIHGEEIQHLRRMIDNNDFETGMGVVKQRYVLGAYQDDLKAKADIKRPLKIVLDSGNGSASEIAPKLFTDLGCEVIPLYCEIDGNFPNHLPDPTVAKYVVDLIAKVKETGADLGIGYDGDADRIGAIDSQGRIVPGDRLVAIFAREALKRESGRPIVFDIKCSQGLAEDIEAHGGVPIMWKTGHSNSKSKMKETGAPVAGELSGHIFFADDFYGYDDAIYASTKLVGIVANGDESLAEIADSIPSYVSTPEIRVDVTNDEDKFRVVKELVDYFKKDYDVIDIDGVRIQFGDGWALVRASNTQPVVGMRFEAKNEARLKEIGETVLAKVREYPSVDLSGVTLDPG